MVVDNVVWMWLALTVKDHMVVQEGLGLNVGRCLGFFYTDDGMVEAQESEWLQKSLNVLIDLFYRYGLVKNVEKSWTMTYQPGALRSGMSEEVEGWQCTGLRE